MTSNGCPVLVVEDSENTAAMLEIALSDIPGVSIVLASSALEAWRILSGQGPSIRAIVTDLNMPRMDGFELIRRVRADGRLVGHTDRGGERRHRPGHSPADRRNWE